MLGFFSAKSDHPLVDPKESKRLFADLQSAEPATALDDAMVLLESLAVDTLVGLEQRVAVLQQVDASVALAAQRFARSYAATNPASRSEDLRQWRLGYGYWSQLSLAYVDVLHDLEGAASKVREALKPGYPLLFVRALHAFSVHLKWQQFRYGPIEEGLWQRAGQVYLQACALDVAQKTCAEQAPYPASTPEREYLKLLAFYASSMDSLLPQEIELADRMLDELLPQFQFSAQERPDSVYWLDAAQNLPPTRLAIKPAPAATLRYFSPGQAVSKANALREQLDGGLPATLNLGTAFTTTQLDDVLSHLALNWSPIPPQRSHPRHQIKSRMDVVAGLGHTYKRMLLGAMDEDVEVSSWVVEDVSQGGMRAQVGLSAGQSLAVNALLLMRPEGGSNWLLGLVRRVSRESDTSAMLGIETIAKQPRAMNVDSGGIRTEVIMLDAWEAAATVRMVLPPQAWEDNIAMTFEDKGRPVKLVPEAQVQAGPDYLIGRYKVRIAE